MKKVFSFLAAALFAVSMFADPFTLTFKDWGDTTPKADKDNAPANTVGDYGTAYTTANLKDSIDGAAYMGDVTDATKLYAARVGYGLKLGSGSATGKLAFNLATPAEFDSIVFRAASYGASEGSVKINGGDAIDLTNAGADNKVLKNIVVTPAGLVSAISFETTVKRAFLKSITFYPKSGAPTPGPEYVIEGSIAGTLTPANPALLTTGWSGSGTNRGGFALGSDALYFANYATGHMGKMQLDLSAFADDADSIGKGYYMDIDAAGHYVIYEWTGGSATLDAAQVYGADKQFIRRDELGLLARCDMPSCVGDLTAGRAAYFAACNSANAVLRYNLVDGVMTTIDTIAMGFTMGSNNNVSALDVDHFTVQSRGNALAYVDCSGATPVVTNMPYFGASTFTSAYGGQVFKFAGHTLYVMGTYKVGGYMGSFAVFDITDPAKPYQIAEEPTKLGGSAMGTACVTFRVAVEGQTATIYEYAAFQVRKYTLTVSPACYLKQGNEGAEWVSMTAGENGFTYEAVLAADSLYINGAAADAGATMFRLADATVNGTVAVNDTVRFTYNNGALTIDSLGHFVPTVVFNVVVPENTPACYIAGTLNSWGFTRMSQLDATHYTYTWRAEGANAATVAYKYCAGADWAYVEKGANGEELANRAWAESDTVRTWLAVPTVNTITYELNGGVMNDYGWTSKGAVLFDMQNDFNPSKTWVKWEDGVYYYHCGNNADETPIWLTEEQAAGQASTVVGFVQNTTWTADGGFKAWMDNNLTKYGWILDVIKANRAAQGLGVDEAAMVDGVYRKEISGFFLASPAEGSWPASSSFETTAGADFYAPIWKHALANPETVSSTFILNAPYKEGFTFDGWYANADFSGDKVLSINENTPSCTLYAKWIEYIMTVKEVVDAADEANVKFAGVVTYVNGKNVYVQDATGGMLVYLTANATCKAGDRIVVTGTRTTYGGAPEVKNAEITSSEAATMPNASKVTLGQLMANPLGYFATRVYVEGLTVTSLDSYKNPFVTDGVDTVQCYKMSVDDAVITVGAKVNITAIAGYYNKFQFVGDAAGIVLAPKAGADNYKYPARGENGEYTLVNEWLYSEKLDNFSANKPANNDYARGMAAKDGIMYFVNRETASLTRVNAKTGEMMAPLPITGEAIFKKKSWDAEKNDSVWVSAVTLEYNDIKFDNAGHALIGACMTSGSQHFMIYSVDLTTGAATKLIDEVLVETYHAKSDSTTRFDAFGVYGDVTGRAIVMAMDAMSYNAFRWEFNNGVAGPAIKVPLNINATDNTYLLDEKGELIGWNSGAPQCFPVDEDYFYIDAHACLPTLFQYELDEDQGGAVANFVDDFKSCPTGVAVVNNEGDTCKMNQGHNGLCEFELNGEYFIVLAATNTAGTPTSSFALYKYANAAKEFSGMTPMWYFPAAGMGGTTNGCRTAVPSVEVDNEKGEATLYVYTNNNGYGVYTFKSTATGNAVDNINAENAALKVLENGHVYIIKNGVRYSVLGVRVK